MREREKKFRERETKFVSLLLSLPLKTSLCEISTAGGFAIFYHRAPPPPPFPLLLISFSLLLHLRHRAVDFPLPPVEGPIKRVFDATRPLARYLLLFFLILPFFPRRYPCLSQFLSLYLSREHGLRRNARGRCENVTAPGAAARAAKNAARRGCS